MRISPALGYDNDDVHIGCDCEFYAACETKRTTFGSQFSPTLGSNNQPWLSGSATSAFVGSCQSDFFVRLPALQAEVRGFL